jgi:hypothetical protein
VPPRASLGLDKGLHPRKKTWKGYGSRKIWKKNKSPPQNSNSNRKQPKITPTRCKPRIPEPVPLRDNEMGQNPSRTRLHAPPLEREQRVLLKVYNQTFLKKIKLLTLKSALLTAPFFPSKSFHFREKKVAKWLLTSSFPFPPNFTSQLRNYLYIFPLSIPQSLHLKSIMGSTWCLTKWVPRQNLVKNI